MKTLVLYDSMGGNTEKVAKKIHQVTSESGAVSTLIKLDESTELDFYDYDLVFLGSPDIEWLPTPKMMEFLHKKKLLEHRMRGDVLPSAPIRPQKFAVCFATFCGAHTGINEVLSVTQWLASFLEHIGYMVLEKIHIPGEMRNFGQAKGWMNDERLAGLNERGRLGNIKGRPNEHDLLDVETHVQGILSYLKFYFEPGE
jgi:menaquinone-dependent protoporphyrinogen IX oxidase